jgi:hypothetical protein
LINFFGTHHAKREGKIIQQRKRDKIKKIIIKKFLEGGKKWQQQQR